jgi:hypothetical protein
MRVVQFTAFVLLGIVALLSSGCGGGGLTSLPTAAIAVDEGTSVVPGTTLHLRGDQSQPTTGQTITRYVWTVETPNGATGTLTPTTEATNPTFVTDVAGDYTFGLTVYQGTTSCAQPAQVTVHVQPPDTTLAPVAVIRVQEGLHVAPLTTLHLSADLSEPMAGSEIDTWEWSVDGPDGSVTTFAPSASVESPTLEANVVGNYVFHLTVRQGGTASAQPAQATVVVAPTDAIHVELTWHTPGDPNEADTGPEAGSDMDIHVVHPLGPANPASPDLDGDGHPDPYFDTLYDCFWFNPHPDWGPAGASGDPSLDRDDTDGGGPEIVALETPQDGVRYRIAVHYWADHAYGAATATVRIFVDGTLVSERGPVELVNRDMWCVADVDSPSGTVTPLTAPGGTGSWITHDYNHPNFQ